LGIFYLPFFIPKQLETVQLLQKTPFLSYAQKKFLADIEKTLKFRIPLSEHEKQKLQVLLTKFGFMI